MGDKTASKRTVRGSSSTRRTVLQTVSGLAAGGFIVSQTGRATSSSPQTAREQAKHDIERVWRHGDFSVIPRIYAEDVRLIIYFKSIEKTITLNRIQYREFAKLMHRMWDDMRMNERYTQKTGRLRTEAEWTLSGTFPLPTIPPVPWSGTLDGEGSHEWRDQPNGPPQCTHANIVVESSSSVERALAEPF